MTDIFSLAREATGEPFTFEVDGETLTISHIGDLDQFALSKLYLDDDGDLPYLTGLFELALGDRIGQLRALNLSRANLIALHAAYLKHCGTSTGESPASSV